MGDYPIPSRLGGLAERRKHQPQTIFGRFIRNFVRFYAWFSVFWMLVVKDNNIKTQENITGVSKVTLHT